jgi:DNA helicase II / ATP-dependent DNA helicase PcrA
MYITEKEEKEHLDAVVQKLRHAYEDIEIQIANASKDIIDTKKYIWNNIDQLDLAEKAANRIAVNEAIDFGEKAKVQKQRLKKMILSPYFGRIDFISETENEEKKEYYIGIHSFTDKKGMDNLIYDWRAPVSSMYYDFETGHAFYHAPIGLIEGDITRKRQFKIKNSIMEYLLESSLSIGDEILQKELSKTSDEKMKNIVATIQREQNIIIRDESAKIMIIQGRAGSGKSSIAMHRVAFLLYRYRGEILAEDILIISPNKVFADYISNVLPELGEENIPELEFDELARDLLGNKIMFQTHAEQIEYLLLSNQEDYLLRVKEKSTLEFLNKLDTFLQIADTDFFIPTDIELNGFKITSEEIHYRYNADKNIPTLIRINKIAKDIINKLRDLFQENDLKWSPKEGNQVKKQLLLMLRFKNTMDLYQYFYEYYNFQYLYRNTKVMEYSDVFPFLYFKIFYEGISTSYKHIRHLLIDEMQDYTPIQYAIIKKLFQCKMTIMGDRNQSITPHRGSTSDLIHSVFSDAQCMELVNSYRSTYEIIEFSRMISPDINILPVERHGEEVSLIDCKTEESELKRILDIIKKYDQNNGLSVAILCKSQSQAERLYENLRKKSDLINMLGYSDNKFLDGIIITSIHMAKGLEFDHVLIPQVNSKNYHTALDRNLLYVACTRAMHKLEISFSGAPSDFLQGVINKIS